MESKPNQAYTTIQLNDNLLKHPSLNLSPEYIGTFNLELAREKEEIDFFALGHPLINGIIDFCRSNSFASNFTYLNLKRSHLPNRFNSLSNNNAYVLIFNVKFQGYIIENQYIPIVVNQQGTEIEGLADFILDIEKYNQIYKFHEQYEIGSLDKYNIEEIIKKAKSVVKKKTSMWKQEIKALNDKIFNLEKIKKKKIYSYKEKVLLLKKESLQQILERKKKKIPTERQMKNILSLTDETRKNEKLNKVKQIEEEILFLDKDLRIIGKKMDDLSFEYEDIKNDMIKRNLAKFYTNLTSLAILRIVD